MPYEQVWGLLVDGSFEPGLSRRASDVLPVRTGDARVDLQAALAMLAPQWGLGQLIDIDDERGARGPRARVCDGALVRRPVRPRRRTAARAAGGGRQGAARSPSASCCAGAARSIPLHAQAIDAYWVSAAEHGMNASTFTARVVASTGADVAAALSAAVGALSGPLHGGAPSRVLKMLDEVEARGDAALGREALDRGERLMGFGHRVYRAEDPRARVLRRTARELGAPRLEVAEALEQAALAELPARKPGPRARHQRRVLVGGRARLRGDPAGAVHADVRLRAHRRLVGAHPRAEARGPADPPEREVCR